MPSARRANQVNQAAKGCGQLLFKLCQRVTESKLIPVTNAGRGNFPTWLFTHLAIWTCQLINTRIYTNYRLICFCHSAVGTHLFIKTIMSKLTTGCAIFLNLIACSLAQADNSALLSLSNSETLSYQGGINEAGYQEFKAKLGPQIRQLIIKSEGGDAASGLKMASLIQQHKLRVVIRDYCISSCFNYVFLAGAEKSLLPDSVLGFHGFPIQKPEKTNASEADADHTASKALEVLGQVKESGYLLLLQQGISEDLPAQLQQRLELAFPDQAKQTRVAKLSLGGKTYSHAADDKLADWFAGLIQKQTKKHKAQGKKGTVPFSLTIENLFGDQAYFPSQTELEALGVRGIRDYPYPANADDFKRFIDKFRKQHGFENIGIAGADFSPSNSPAKVSASPK